MEKLVNQVRDLQNKVSCIKSKCKEYAKLMKRKYGDNDPRAHCFIMIYNQALVTFELLKYYHDELSRQIGILASVEEIGTLCREQMNKQHCNNVERCMIATRCMFIITISIIEFSMKKTRRLSPQTTLNNVIEKSRKNGLIDAKEEEIWNFIRFVRNCTVHNNSIASRDYQTNIDGRDHQCKEGKDIKGNLDYYLFLSSKAIDCFFSWAKRIK